MQKDSFIPEALRRGAASGVNEPQLSVCLFAHHFYLTNFSKQYFHTVINYCCCYEYLSSLIKFYLICHFTFAHTRSQELLICSQIVYFLFSILECSSIFVRLEFIYPTALWLQYSINESLRWRARSWSCASRSCSLASPIRNAWPTWPNSSRKFSPGLQSPKTRW